MVTIIKMVTILHMVASSDCLKIKHLGAPKLYHIILGRVKLFVIYFSYRKPGR